MTNILKYDHEQLYSSNIKNERYLYRSCSQILNYYAHSLRNTTSLSYLFDCCICCPLQHTNKNSIIVIEHMTDVDLEILNVPYYACCIASCSNRILKIIWNTQTQGTFLRTEGVTKHMSYSEIL